MFSDLPNVCFDSKQDSLFSMIYLLLEKLNRCAQMSVDCLRASKLVILGYTKSRDLLYGIIWDELTSLNISNFHSTVNQRYN